MKFDLRFYYEDYFMKNYLISGLVDKYRIKMNLFAMSPKDAIKVFQTKYPKAEDIYVMQDLFKGKWFRLINN